MYRILDLFIAIPLLLLLLPLFAVVAIVLLMTGEHLVIYRQVRIGRFGQTFKIYKFVTMLENSPNMGAGTLTVENDDRILPIGRFLRSSKINELPQIVNVLLGDMSLVGHRPLAQREYGLYDVETLDHIERLRPGVTGIASIMLRNENSIYPSPHDASAVIEFYAKEIAPYKASLERWFAKNRTFSNYIKILFATAIVVISNNPNLTNLLFKNLPRPSAELQRCLNRETEPK